MLTNIVQYCAYHVRTLEFGTQYRFIPSNLPNSGLPKIRSEFSTVLLATSIPGARKMHLLYTERYIFYSLAWIDAPDLRVSPLTLASRDNGHIQVRGFYLIHSISFVDYHCLFRWFLGWTHGRRQYVSVWSTESKNTSPQEPSFALAILRLQRRLLFAPHAILTFVTQVRNNRP